MKTLGNIIWFLLGGIISGLNWCFVGFLWCITIVGIPVGLQCFKLSAMSFFPFGKEIVYSGGPFSCFVNVIWFIFGGIEMAVINCLLGLLWCITIVGIPFGLQFFKLAKLSLAPFGAEIVYTA